MASSIRKFNTAISLASPKTVTLAGKKYRLTPLKQRDWGEFEQWLQDQHIALAKRNLANLSDADRECLLKHAYNRAAEITFQSPEAVKAMKSFDGAVKLTWLSLRAEHPDLIEENVATMLLDPKTLEHAMDELPLGISRDTKKKPLRKTQRKKRKDERNRRKTSV